MRKTIGIVVVAALAASTAASVKRRSRPPDGQPIRRRAPAIDILIFRPAVFDRHVLALDKPASFRPDGMQPELRARPRRHPLSKPITGIAGCCARAASGHAAAAPPRSVMNSRRCNRFKRIQGLTLSKRP